MMTTFIKLGTFRDKSVEDKAINKKNVIYNKALIHNKISGQKNIQVKKRGKSFAIEIVCSG